MDARLLQLADVLLLIERELRVQGWWASTPPSASALASVEPFAVDAMAFEVVAVGVPAEDGNSSLSTGRSVADRFGHSADGRDGVS